jgi:hypothetical protein
MQRYGWSNGTSAYSGGTWSWQAIDTGEWVKYSDAEAEIGSVRRETSHDSDKLWEGSIEAAIHREREEIIKMLDKSRFALLEPWLDQKTARGIFDNMIDLIRARGEGKSCRCDWNPELLGHSPDCPCHKKPGKIARLEVPISVNGPDMLRVKINELIDRENARG